MTINIKRIYETPARTDGTRILVDRLWPRGVSKSKAQLDLWLKEIAPSTKLRKWFAHDPKKWTEFQKRYKLELKENAALLKELRRIAKNKRVTLLYGAKDQEHNEAVVLQNLLKR